MCGWHRLTAQWDRSVGRAAADRTPGASERTPAGRTGGRALRCAVSAARRPGPGQVRKAERTHKHTDFIRPLYRLPKTNALPWPHRTAAAYASIRRAAAPLPIRRSPCAVRWPCRRLSVCRRSIWRAPTGRPASPDAGTISCCSTCPDTLQR